jgi:hypothetical protein
MHFSVVLLLSHGTGLEITLQDCIESQDRVAFWA